MDDEEGQKGLVENQQNPEELGEEQTRTVNLIED